MNSRPVAPLVELALSDQQIERLADLVADRLRSSTCTCSSSGDGWLDSRGAAEHLGISLDALHKATAARVVPFAQDRPAGKLWFKPSELDEWRARGRRGPA